MKFVDPFAPVARASTTRGRTATPATPAPGPQPSAGEPRNPERMNKAELVEWARELGLPTGGTKAELVDRIRGAV